LNASIAFELKNITKRFGAVTANQDCNLIARKGSIHAVVGENGAGKSTILKILYGEHHADEGEIYIKGALQKHHNPVQSIRLGVGMVHQHFALVPTLKVWENVILGEEPTLLKLPKKDIIEKTQSLCNTLGYSLNLEKRIDELTVGEQQQVEILKILYRDAETLILDEPTAVLTPQETVKLLERLKLLQSQGKTIVFISHKLKEVLAIAEDITVMRQGKVVLSRSCQGMTQDQLAELMIGRKVEKLPALRKPASPESLIEVKDVSLTRDKRESLKNISFKIQRGEILGIAGVEGNGQTELIEVLSNVERNYSGEIFYHGKALKSQQTYNIRQQKYAFVPADRHRDALILDFSMADNFLLGHHRESYFQKKKGLLSPQKVYAHAKQNMERFDVRPPLPYVKASGFSGGNQQKMILARELAGGSDFVLAAHPTRGVDIGAIEFIHKEFFKLRESGSGILLISSELEEVLALSDRILVFYEGRIQGECLRKDATEQKLGIWMTGGHA